MTEDFNRFLREAVLLSGKEKILLAVSGGIDSMVMADLFRTSGVFSAIAHCNFSLRGDESDGDEAFVMQYASRNGIPFHHVRFDTAGFAVEKGISIQMAARELRYQWFEEIREKNGYDFIALAHNMNDNVETFIINLTRGTGIAGLTGMKPVHGKLIRPLLFASRKAIESFAGDNSISFREDHTNADIKYTRNRIRHKLLPLFREINPAFDHTITETAERLGEVNEILQAYISAVRKVVVKSNGETICVKTSDIPESPYRKTILFELFRPFGVTKGQLVDLEKLTTGRSGRQIFTDNYRLVKNRKEILIIARDQAEEEYYETPTPDELGEIPLFDSVTIIDADKMLSLPGSCFEAMIDFEKLSWPLIIRHPLNGDFFYPLGMQSRKKLSDFFIDRKYSLPEKERKLVIESAGRIVWIIGDRIDNRFRITVSTRKILHLSVSWKYR